jgi:hypothetical protein
VHAKKRVAHVGLRRFYRDGSEEGCKEEDGKEGAQGKEEGEEVR